MNKYFICEFKSYYSFDSSGSITKAEFKTHGSGLFKFNKLKLLPLVGSYGWNKVVDPEIIVLNVSKFVEIKDGGYRIKGGHQKNEDTYWSFVDKDISIFEANNDEDAKLIYEVGGYE